MADIVYTRVDRDAEARRLIINGIDYSHEVYADTVRVVEVAGEVGLQVTFVVSHLDLVDQRPDLASAAEMIRGATKQLREQTGLLRQTDAGSRGKR